MVNQRLQKIRSHLLGLSSSTEFNRTYEAVAIHNTASPSSTIPSSENKIVSPEEAASLVKDGDWITVGR